MNWLFGMINQTISNSFSTKPVPMSYAVHIAIVRITVDEGIDNRIARKNANSTTNHTTTRKFNKNALVNIRSLLNQ